MLMLSCWSCLEMVEGWAASGFSQGSHIEMVVAALKNEITKEEEEEEELIQDDDGLVLPWKTQLQNYGFHMNLWWL